MDAVYRQNTQIKYKIKFKKKFKKVKQARCHGTCLKSHHSGGKGRQIFEFEASLVYRADCRTARAAIQRNPASKKKRGEEEEREEEKKEEEEEEEEGRRGEEEEEGRRGRKKKREGEEEEEEKKEEDEEKEGRRGEEEEEEEEEEKEEEEEEKEEEGWREAQRLRALAAPLKELGSIPSAYMTAYSLLLSVTPLIAPSMHMVHIYVHSQAKIPIHIK